MNDDAKDLAQIDEEILTYEASDEALEAAAGTGRVAAPTHDDSTMVAVCCGNR